MAFVERQRGAQHLAPMTDRHEHAGWSAVARLDEIVDGRGVVRRVNGLDIAVMREGDTVYALDNTCPHRGGQLGDGRVDGGKVICPLHSWDFDLRTGISPFNPADSVRTFPARVHDGVVEVDADAVPLAPPRPDVYLGQWTRRGATDRGMYLVHHLAEGLPPFVEAMGSERNEPNQSTRHYPSFDDITFKPAQLDRLPLLDHDPVATDVVIGTRAAKPLRLHIPLYVSHMSFGALSVEAKEALARGATIAGTAICSGEGGAHPRERAAADRYIFEMASGYFGWTSDAITHAEAIEIKIGQGAKPGLGGLLPGPKVTPEIAAVRGVPEGVDAHSPAHFPDINSAADVARRVAELKDMTGGVPIGIKFAAGNVERDLAAAIEAGADFVTIDGLGGGTGAAPVHVKDHVSIPSLFGLYRARTWMEGHGVHDVQLVSTGGYRTPDEMAKALALGADAIAIATSALMAIGCQQYRACHRGSCPVGIATQIESLRERLDVEISAERLASFLGAATSMIVDYTRLTGHHRVSDLSRSDLVTLHPDLARHTDLDYLL